MEWKKYLELSEKTLSSEFHVGKQTENILHAVMGICTELEELMDNYVEINTTLEATNWNKLEEIGDIFWYLAIIHREYPDIKQSLFKDEDNFPNIQKEGSMSSDKLVLSMTKSSLKMLDMLKKKLFYNREINITVFENLVLLLESDLLDLCKIEDIYPEDICQVNIDKLKARYGEKFSSSAANNRNLDIEKDILDR